jgi:hypothetical protein
MRRLPPLERANHPPDPYAQGDGRPQAVQFLKHFRSLAPDVPDDFLRSIWSSRLPPNVQAILAGELALRTASSRPHRGQRSRALSHSPTAVHFCSESRTSPARWEHSTPSEPPLPSAPRILAPTPGTPAPVPGTVARAVDPPPKMTLHPPSAGTIAAMEPGRKSVLSLTPTTSRETNTANINSGTCLHYNHKLPLHHGQAW